MTHEEQLNLQFKDKDFYFQFQCITDKLDSIFSIEAEINKKKHFYAPYIYMSEILRCAVPWLQGRTYKSIIDIRLKRNEELDTDKVIRDVISSINDHVRFLLVKYFKLLSDILKDFMDEEELEEYGYVLKIPQMLEMGGCRPWALELMNEGINRSVANKIAEIIPRHYEGSAIDWLKENKDIKMPYLFKKHLEHQGF